MADAGDLNPGLERAMRVRVPPPVPARPAAARNRSECASPLRGRWERPAGGRHACRPSRPCALIALPLIPADLVADSAGRFQDRERVGPQRDPALRVRSDGDGPGSGARKRHPSLLPGSSSPKNLTLNRVRRSSSPTWRGDLYKSRAAGSVGLIGPAAPDPREDVQHGVVGTYGVSLPVVGSDRAPFSRRRRGQPLDQPGRLRRRRPTARTSPWSSDDSGGAATVTIYDADGNARGSQDFGSPLRACSNFRSGASREPYRSRAQIAVTRGHAAGYAVVVDNVTGDSSLFAFEDLPGAARMSS